MTSAQRRFLRFIVKKGGSVSYRDMRNENRRLCAKRKRTVCDSCGSSRLSSYAPINHHGVIDVLRRDGFIQFIKAHGEGVDAPFWAITSAGLAALAKRGGTR